MTQWNQRPIPPSVLADAGIDTTPKPKKERKPRKPKAEREQEALNPGRAEWLAECQYFGDGFREWRKRIKEERNFDPVGFYERILTGIYEVNAEGLGGDDEVGIMPFLPRLTQRLWCREIIWHRWSATDDAGWARFQQEFPKDAEKYGRPTGRFMRLVVKNRRAGFTTGEVMAGVADADVNAGANMAISSYDVKEGLENVSELLRTALGDSKEAAAGAIGMAQKRFKTASRTLIRLLSPNESMGRGFSYNHLLWTEVDYLDDIEGALKSVRPSIRKDVFACIVLETTIRKDAETGFKDYVERTQKGLTAFRLYFQGWLRDETATVVPTKGELAAIAGRESMAGAEDYEFKVLRDELGASDGQIAWWRRRFKEDADSNLSAMMEMYPAKLEEAMAATRTGEFLHKNALEWIESTCGEPERRLKIATTGMVELQDVRDWKANSHMAEWSRPEWGEEYVVGADIADEEERTGEVGSENYAFVVNKNTGEQCAEWHGNATAPEFAHVLCEMAKWYNNALIVPEANRGLGVIRHLNDNLEYPYIYRRESLASDAPMQSNNFGFYTSSATRPVLVERVQDAVNGRKVLIRSKKLLEQLVGFAKRRGRPQKRQAKGHIADDGVVAMALSTFGHDGLSSGMWRSWTHGREVERPKAQQVEAPPAARMRRVIFDDEQDVEDYSAARRRMNRT